MLASRQIINAMVTRLIDAQTDAAARVYSNRAWPVAEFPGIKVLASDEDLDADNDDITWPRERQHTLQVLVMGIVRDVADLDDAMDELVEQILIALEGSEAASLLDPLPGVRLRAVRISRQLAAEGEASAGTVVITFEADFNTASNNPSQFLS